MNRALKAMPARWSMHLIKRYPYVFSVAAFLLCLALRQWLGLIEIGTPYTPFFLAAALSTWAGGRSAGLLTTGLGFLASLLLVSKGGYSSADGVSASIGPAVYLVVSFIIVLVIDSLQRSQRMTVALEDTLAKRNTELSRERDRVRMTLASIGDGVITTGIDQHIEFMNAEAERLTGIDCPQAIGLDVDHVVTLVESGDDGLTRRYRVLNVSDVPWRDSARLHIEHKSGTRVAVAVTVAPIHDPQGHYEGVVMVLRDVTDYRNNELALHEADRRKDEFLAILAHELRNPLAPLQNALNALDASRISVNAQVMTNQHQEWPLAVMRRQLHHLVRLVDDLLDVSRITRGKLELCLEAATIEQVISDALETVSSVLSLRQHRVEMEPSGDDARVWVDRTRSAQIFVALLNNSAMYTPPGGLVRIVTTLNADEVKVAVSDNGAGIEASTLSTIFQLFYRSDRKRSHGGGLGVGLALARRLAELHGGGIEVSSAGAGLGSTFTVRLPRMPAAIQTSPAIGFRVVESQPLRVVAIDDNPDSADSLAALVNVLGHETRVAYDAKDGIRLVEEFKPRLVVVDIGMPGMNGYELAQHLRSNPVTRDVHLVALTGWGSDKDIQRAKAAGFDRHLTKPLRVDQLKALISYLH